MKGENDFIYDFEPFRINAVKRQLWRDGKVLPITSKAFETLLILVRHRGETVSKDELMNSVWLDTAVEENNLTQQISALRKALGDDARQPRFIITIPGKGYSFIAPVKEDIHRKPDKFLGELTTPDPALDKTENENKQARQNKNALVETSHFTRLLQTTRPLLPVLFLAVAVFTAFYIFSFLNAKSTICVMPFKSLDNNAKSNLYSSAIPSFVTAKIGEIPNVIVRPVVPSEQNFGHEQNVIAIGRDNNVDTVLTGSTQCEGDIVQVTVHLWDVKNNRQIWAKIFTRQASDALSAQDAISEEIIFALRTELAN